MIENRSPCFVVNGNVAAQTVECKVEPKALPSALEAFLIKRWNTSVLVSVVNAVVTALIITGPFRLLLFPLRFF